MFIDIHCHLDACENIDKIVGEAKKKDLIIVTAGMNFSANRQSLDLASKYSCVKAVIGLYPEDALKLTDKEINNELKFIEKNKSKIIGIGEIGLDRTYLSIEKQKRVFEKQVKLAIKLDIPVVVHSRKMEEETILELEKLKAKKVVMHCFSGNLKLVKRIEKNGWMLSIPANIVFSTHFQEVVKIVKIENLLCETDSPFLSPFRKFSNSPMNVIESYKKIAEIKNLSLKDIEEQIEANFKKMFKEI